MPDDRQSLLAILAATYVERPMTGAEAVQVLLGLFVIVAAVVCIVAWKLDKRRK